MYPAFYDDEPVSNGSDSGSEPPSSASQSVWAPFYTYSPESSYIIQDNEADIKAMVCSLHHF
jgi:hypothetical protein